MADRVVGMDVRALVVAWPDDAPRGAVARFCREHGVSRSWFYEVRDRALSEPATQAMLPRPRRYATRHPQAVPLEVEELAVRIRKELADQGLDHGPVTVRWQLQQMGLTAPAASTLARIFTRRGMVVPAPAKRPKSSYRRFEYAQVHECWQLDAMQWKLADGTVCVVFQLLDDCSRLLIASRVASAENAEDAIAVFDQGVAAHQVPCLLLTDNGVAFNQSRLGRTSRLATHVSALGCRPITGRPGHPQTQGKNERVHQPLQAWLRAHSAPRTHAELQRLVEAFDEVYNHRRPHQSLAMTTPAQAAAARPRAVAPLPPALTVRTTSALPVRAVRRKVSGKGKISIGHRQIFLGAEHRQDTVTAIITDATVAVFDPRGRLIRTVVLVPGQTYYGNGRPKTWRRNQEASTLT